MTERDPVFGCDLATGRLDKDGYAYHGRSRAHIVAWIAANGSLPVDSDGKPWPLDHLCRRRSCSALHHLEPVTKGENERRKSWRYRAAMKRCPRGHSLDLALVTPEMGRLCRTCHADPSAHVMPPGGVAPSRGEGGAEIGRAHV